MTFTIDKNIPAPTSRTKLPFRSMAVGDSVFLPHYTASTQSRKKRELGFKLTSPANIAPDAQWRTEARVEEGVAGLRVWRVG